MSTEKVRLRFKPREVEIELGDGLVVEDGKVYLNDEVIGFWPFEAEIIEEENSETEECGEDEV